MSHRLKFLAPPGSEPGFGTSNLDSNRWQTLFTRACKVRGSAYIADGAITSNELDSHGSFQIPIDKHSWHVVLVDDDDEVCATLRMTMLPLDSQIRRGNLPHVGESLRRAASDHCKSMLVAERFLSGLGLAYGAERKNFLIVGGWATDPANAPANAGAELALSVWAFARHMKTAGALCVASERHDAHEQLIRTGAVPIRAVGSQPMYFDEAYGCRVGLLGFRVFQERKTLKRVVDHISQKLMESEVICIDGIS